MSHSHENFVPKETGRPKGTASSTGQIRCCGPTNNKSCGYLGVPKLRETSGAAKNFDVLPRDQLSLYLYTTFNSAFSTMRGDHGGVAFPIQKQVSASGNRPDIGRAGIGCC